MTCNSAQAQKIYRKRILEAIAALNDCLPEASGVQSISENLVNACTTFEGAESVLALQLKEALCWLANGGAVDNCDRPIPGCPEFQVLTGAAWGPNLHIYDAFARGFNLPELVTANQSIIFNTSLDGATPSPMDWLLTVTMPELTTVLNSVICSFHPNLVTFSAPKLTDVTGYFGVGSNASLSEIDVSALINVGGTLGMGGNLWTHADLHSLVSVGDDLEISGAELLTVDLSSLTALGGDFIAENSSLTEDAVNYILVLLDGITPALTGITIRLNLGLSAAPTGAGAAAAANLAILNTVLTN